MITCQFGVFFSPADHSHRSPAQLLSVTMAFRTFFVIWAAAAAEPCPLVEVPAPVDSRIFKDGGGETRNAGHFRDFQGFS